MTLNNEIKSFNPSNPKFRGFFKERESFMGPVSLKMACVSYKLFFSTEKGIPPAFFMKNLCNNSIIYLHTAQTQ